MLAGNLTNQVRNIAFVTTAVANGDLSQKITVDARGEVLELKNTINSMVDQLRTFAAEVTRVAKEVGVEGKLGVQADIKGMSGTWKDLTDNVNLLAGNLTSQVRNIALVTTAVANGDLSQEDHRRRQGRDPRAQEHHQRHGGSAADLRRRGHPGGPRGRHRGQARRAGPGARAWPAPGRTSPKTSTRWPRNLTNQVRGIVKVVTAVANGDLSQKFVIEAKGEIAALADTINDMTGTLRTFADQVTTVAREVGTEGKLGGQAKVPGRRRHLARPHRQRQHAGRQPDQPGAQHRRRHHRRRHRRPVAEDHRRRQGRDPRAQEHHQRHGRAAAHLRPRGDPRRPRGRHRGQARRPGPGARRGRHLAGPHRQRQPDGLQPDQPGARHRQGRHRGRRGRPGAEAGASRPRARSPPSPTRSTT